EKLFLCRAKSLTFRVTPTLAGDLSGTFEAPQLDAASSSLPP
ncbi:hypothetical protein SAMN05421505_1873, partial [Sinosporangium album]